MHILSFFFFLKNYSLQSPDRIKWPTREDKETILPLSLGLHEKLEELLEFVSFGLGHKDVGAPISSLENVKQFGYRIHVTSGILVFNANAKER